MFQNLVIPSVKALGLSLSIPYLLSHGLAPSIISSPSVLIALQRRIYPLLLLVTALAVFFTVQARQFKKLVEHIKNDRFSSLVEKVKNFRIFSGILWAGGWSTTTTWRGTGRSRLSVKRCSSLIERKTGVNCCSVYVSCSAVLGLSLSDSEDTFGDAIDDPDKVVEIMREQF